MTKTSMLRTSLLAGAALGLLMAAAPKEAHAVSYAYSALEIENFLATNEFGGFTTFNFVAKQISVDLNGAGANSGPVTESGSGATIDLPQVCVGNCGSFSENTFFPAPTPLTGPAGSYAVADQFLEESRVLSGSGGWWGAMSGVQLGDGDAVAESGTQHQLQWDFNISAAELTAGGGEVTIDFAWDQRNFLELVTTQSGDTANATQSFTIRVTGPEDFEDEIFDFSESISAGQSPSSKSFGTETFFANSTTATFTTAGNYSMLFNYDVSSNATSVPEPGTIGLLGMGLLGLGAYGIRRRSKTAA